MIEPWAVVLGASTGTGAQIAIQLARRGYNIVGIHRGRHREDAEQTLRTIRDTTSMWCEMREGDAGKTFNHVAAAIDAVSRVTQRVDVLVHSLTSAAVGPMLELPPHRIESTFNNLAHSFFWWTQRLHQLRMFAPGAKVLALSNPCPDLYIRNLGVIGAAKAALENYVKMLAVELGPSGVHVNGIRFATVVTPALKAVLSPEAIAHLGDVNDAIMPCRRSMTCEDVAYSVCGLVADNWINGAIVDLTGGGTLTLLDHALYGAPAD